jgi:O-antigen ligase
MPPTWSRRLNPCFGILPYLMYASILGCLIFAGAVLRRAPGAIGQQLLHSGLAIVAVLLLVSSFQAVDLGEAALQLSHFLPYFWLWAALVVYLSQHPQADTVLIRWSWILVLGAAPIGVLALGEYWLSRFPDYSLQQLLDLIPPLDWIYTGVPGSRRAYAVFNNPNTLASYCVMTVGLIIGLLAVTETQRQPQSSTPGDPPSPLIARPIAARIGLGLCLLSTLTGLYCSGSRNGYLAAAIVLVLGLLALRRIAWIRWCGLLTLGAFTASTLTFGIRGRAPSWDWFTRDARMAAWQLALRRTQESPWWGHGLGSYNLLYDGSVPGHSYIGHAHNLWLSLTAETGLITTFALTSVVGLMLYRAARALLTSPPSPLSAIALGYGLCFLAVMVLSIFDVTYYDARHNILAWLCLAALGSLPVLIAKGKD